MTGRTARSGADGMSRPGDTPSPPAERVVTFRLRTVVAAVAVVIAAGAAVEVIRLARTGLVLIALAGFLAIALSPAVGCLTRRGLRRPWAVAAVYLLGLLALAAIGLLLVTPLVGQISALLDALPSVVADITRGRGPLGVLETHYHVVERVRAATSGNVGLLRDASSALTALRGVAGTGVSLVVIAFLTYFMLLEGPDWYARALALVPDAHRPSAARIGNGLYRSVVGFVTGNALASLLAGAFAAVELLAAGVPYVAPLAVFVACVDLIPYVGPVLATVVVGVVAFTRGSSVALIVFALLVAYHVVEAHTIRPLLYARAVALSPLCVLVSIVLCVEIGGILGAIVAIPIAGTVDVAVRELAASRREP